MVEPPLAALNTTVVGWWLARPYSGDVLIWVPAVILNAQLILGLRSLGIALLT